MEVGTILIVVVECLAAAVEVASAVSAEVASAAAEPVEVGNRVAAGGWQQATGGDCRCY